MLLDSVVRTSAAVADSAGRLAKISEIAARLREVPPDLDLQIPLMDEVVVEKADTAFACKQTLPRALDVRSDRGGRSNRGHHNAGETAISSGRPGHCANLSRSAAAASGFSSSSFWM